MMRNRGSAWIVQGQVLSGAQRPIAGAVVSLFAGRDPRASFEDLLGATSTGPDGNYQLQFDSPASGWVQVEKSGFASVEAWLEAVPGEVVLQNHNLEEALGRLTGRVLDLSRSPVQEALLFVSFQQVFSGPGQSILSARTALTDRAGEFFIDGLPNGPVGVMASAEGYLPSAGQSVLLDKGGSNHMEFVLKKGRSIALVIRNNSGRAIASATAVVPGEFVQQADEEGVAHLTVPPESTRVDVEIRADGFLTRKVSFHPEHPPDQVILEQAGVFVGTVSTGSGRPLPGARIQVLDRRGELDHLERVVTSDHRGMFFIPATFSGPTKLVVAKSGFVESVVEFEGSDGIDGTDIRLKNAEGGLYGRAVDRAGNPVAPFVAMIHFQDPSQVEMARTFSNPEGVFAFPDLPAGTLTLTLLSPGDQLSATIEDLKIQEGRLYGDVIVTLEPMPRTPIRPGGIH